MIKIFTNEQSTLLNQLRDCYINLSIPSFLFVPPKPVIQLNAKENWTVWSKLKVSSKETLQEFVDRMKIERNLNVCAISHGKKLIFFNLLQNESSQDYSKSFDQTLREAFPAKDFSKLGICKLIISTLERVDIPPVYCYFSHF